MFCKTSGQLEMLGLALKELIFIPFRLLPSSVKVQSSLTKVCLNITIRPAYLPANHEVKQSFSSSLSGAWSSLCLYICDTWKSYKTVTWLIYECLIALEWVKTNRMHKTILYHFLSHFLFLKILWKLYENIWTRWGWAGPSSAQTGIRLYFDSL